MTASVRSCLYCSVMLFSYCACFVGGSLVSLNPMAGRPGLPGNSKESAAAATPAANSGLWTLGF